MECYIFTFVYKLYEVIKIHIPRIECENDEKDKNHTIKLELSHKQTCLKIPFNIEIAI